MNHIRNVQRHYDGAKMARDAAEEHDAAARQELDETHRLSALSIETEEIPQKLNYVYQTQEHKHATLWHATAAMQNAEIAERHGNLATLHVGKTGDAETVGLGRQARRRGHEARRHATRAEELATKARKLLEKAMHSIDAPEPETE